MKILRITKIDAELKTIYLISDDGIEHTWTRVSGFPLGEYSVGEKYITIGVMIYKMEFGL